jgi:hypothetical protein
LAVCEPVFCDDLSRQIHGVKGEKDDCAGDCEGSDYADGDGDYLDDVEQGLQGGM